MHPDGKPAQQEMKKHQKRKKDLAAAVAALLWRYLGMGVGSTARVDTRHPKNETTATFVQFFY